MSVTEFLKESKVKMTKLNNQINDHCFQAFANEKLHAYEAGEVYLQYLESESYHFVDQTLKSANQDISQGFGLRQIRGKEQAYFYSTDFEEGALKKICDQDQEKKPYVNLKQHQAYYSDAFFLNQIKQQDKIQLLTAIDAYIRKKSAHVIQVSVSLSGQWEQVKIFMKDLPAVMDIRPLVRLNIAVTVKRGTRIEKGIFGIGGRYDYHSFMIEENWCTYADKALEQALINLESVDCPAGQMQIVLGSGWPGILLHEAIGHGLEGDAHRKKTSVFTELMNEMVADQQVTVVDSGVLPNRRGSLNIDDEGTTTQETILIENGKLTQLMYDKFNANLMNTKSTGNGRRESFMHLPMPRMTNTYMRGGKYTSEEIIESVDYGIYATHFSGGQVDITSGKFVFSASEAYLIEKGKITKPVKGMTLIGDGADALKKIKLVGNDEALDDGVGTCGKNGQSVPVGVGQPTLRIDDLVVGGTAL